MTAEIGHFALILALLVALVQSSLPMIGAARGDQALMATARPAAIVQFALVAIAFGCLTALYVTSDFSVLNVVQNSHTQKPLLYKISGVWGNHEGSLLLWVRFCPCSARRWRCSAPTFRRGSGPGCSASRR